MIEKNAKNYRALGGEIRFEQKVTDILVNTVNDVRQIKGVIVNGMTEILSNHVVMALGHSARDTFNTLYERQVFMEAKPFSIGFRIEHPQSIIDCAQFGKNAGHPILGSADYKLVHHASNGRSVYSFCMCPGGTVVAAASEPYHLVTNGMSQYSRNERNANSAIVVGITPADFPSEHPLSGIELQRMLEARAFILGGSNYQAPVQLVGDFIAGVPSPKLGSVTPSYKPGITLCDMSDLLPEYATIAIREALIAFNSKLSDLQKMQLLTGRNQNVFTT